MTGNNYDWVSDSYNPELDHLSGTDNPKGSPAGINKMKISKGVCWDYGSFDEKNGPASEIWHSHARDTTPIPN